MNAPVENSRVSSAPVKRQAKKTVVLVGALSSISVDSIGGVRFACQSLLESPLSEGVRWLLINSTVPLNTRIGRRALLALSRVLRLLYLLVTHPGIDSLLIFGGYDPTSFLEKGTLVLLGKAFGKRVVFSLRTEIRPYGSDHRLMPFRRRVMQRVDKVICQSQFAARKLTELTQCPPDKIAVIPNWINYEKYTRPREMSPVSQPGIHGTTFVFVGHLTKNKAPDVLLNAVSLLKVRGVTFRVVFCGNGPLYDQLQRDITTLGLESQVELRGWVIGDALIQALWAADVFVLPTHSEGMPNALLEAMAAGLPVITTPVSSIPEIVTVPDNGLLVPPGDPKLLADAMEQLSRSSELRAAMGRNNRDRIMERHTIDGSWPLIADIL